MRYCVISCSFGLYFDKFYQAPTKDSYLFSNNKRIKNSAEKRGWNFIYYNLELSGDWIQQSMHSKKVKLLEFLKNNEFKEFFDFEIIIYVDHKFKLEQNHLIPLINHSVDHDIVIRKTGRKDVWDEYQRSMQFPRYNKFQLQTKNYILEQLEKGKSSKWEINNTGVILYKMQQQTAIDLASRVYDDVLRIGSPQC